MMDEFAEERLLGTYQEFTTTTAKYPDNPESSLQAKVMYLALGLSDESGEVAGKIKKWYRDQVIDHQEVQKELGDVLWYLSQLCNELGYDLSTVMTKNRDKLIDRQNRDVISGNGDNR